MLFRAALSMTALILAGFYIGRFIDRILGASPLFHVVFLFLGILAAFRALLVLTKKHFIGKPRG